MTTLVVTNYINIYLYVKNTEKASLYRQVLCLLYGNWFFKFILIVYLEYAPLFIVPY